MQTTLLVFSYPPSAEYAKLPEEYQGEAIEDYSVQVTALALQLGQVIPAYGYEWKVITIHQYQNEEVQGDFAIAILTFDGQTRDMDHDPGNNDDDICQILITPEGYRLSWPEHIDYMVTVGDDVYKAPYQVAQVLNFEPCSTTPSYVYSMVRVGWCIPVLNDINLTEPLQPVLA